MHDDTFEESSPEWISEAVTETAAPIPPYQDAIVQFITSLSELEHTLQDYPAIYENVFRGTEEWRRLLQQKLLVPACDQGCLIVAIAGGTNTGKSTLFNVLVGERISAACSTAAATCAPVLVTAEGNVEAALRGDLLPYFLPCELHTPEDATRRGLPENVLWVGSSARLPEYLALMDTPDIDSIEQHNWQVADEIRAAGDVVVAILTPEKYKDARVVEFFRRAHATGRLVIPVMNKANVRNHFETARLQLAEFKRDVGLDHVPCFAVPFDFEVEINACREIESLDGGPPLLDYLLGLDHVAIKHSVYRATLAYVLDEAHRFVQQLLELRGRLEAIPSSFEKRAVAFASGYHPQPGVSFSMLLHEQVRAQRSALIQRISSINDAIYRGIVPAAGFLRRHVLRLPSAGTLSEAERIGLMRNHHKAHIAQIVNNYGALLFESARDMDPMVGSSILSSLLEIDMEAALAQVLEAMLGHEACDLSEEFKAHVAHTVADWWENHPDLRKLLLELDAFFVLAPTALMLPVAAFTAGVGAPEILALASPLAGEFVARIIEGRYAEKWVGLLQPWQEEQRQKLATLMQEHLMKPAVQTLRAALASLTTGHIEALGRLVEQCHQDLQQS